MLLSSNEIITLLEFTLLIYLSGTSLQFTLNTSSSNVFHVYSALILGVILTILGVCACIGCYARRKGLALWCRIESALLFCVRSPSLCIPVATIVVFLSCNGILTSHTSLHIIQIHQAICVLNHLISLVIMIHVQRSDFWYNVNCKYAHFVMTTRSLSFEAFECTAKTFSQVYASRIGWTVNW